MRVALAIAVAAAAAVVTNLILRALGIAIFDIPDSFEEIAVRAVVLSTLGGVIVAGIVFAIVPTRTYLAIAVVALLLSLIPPLTLDAESGAKATLAAMHVVTAAICVVVFLRGASR
jgi:Family of unknown function (DUF6069)